MLTSKTIAKLSGRDFSGSNDMRCPHDGGKCHHDCETECFRETGGMSLSSPYDGYPINSEDFFNELVVKKVVEL